MRPLTVVGEQKEWQKFRKKKALGEIPFSIVKILQCACISCGEVI